ncbi:MAG: hypothetical protein ACLUFV_11290 [Acutalibacteraceae bacterium]
MCGFIGFYNKNGVGETEQNDAAAMSHAIRHRGPDLDRAYGDGRAHFAFRRLSIIDLRAARSPSSAKTAAISPSTTAKSTTTSSCATS